MSQSIDASNATAKELSYATRKISGEDGVLREASRFTSDILGYGARVEGREGAYIIVNVLASPSALQETSSLTICLTAACSPRRDPAVTTTVHSLAGVANRLNSGPTWV